MHNSTSTGTEKKKISLVLRIGKTNNSITLIYSQTFTDFRDPWCTKEFRQLVIEHTNSAFTDISLSTIKWTVCHHLLVDKPWTRKKVTWSNLYWWNEPSLIYTRAFLRHVSTLDVYNIRFLDESSFHLNTCLRPYGSARRGDWATEISKHYISLNYTLFYLSGLMDKYYCIVTTGPSTTADFIHEVCEGRTAAGAPVISPGCTIFSDNCKIHVG